MDKNSGSESGMNNPDHISGSLETIFCVKILKFFDADPGSGNRGGKNSDTGWKKFGSRVWDPGSAPRIRNTAHKLEILLQNDR
jgi:hypothetical protein